MMKFFALFTLMISLAAPVLADELDWKLKYLQEHQKALELEYQVTQTVIQTTMNEKQQAEMKKLEEQKKVDKKEETK